jgi:hypothetical protein
MIDTELGFNKVHFFHKLRKNYKDGILPKHIIELAETIPNFEWEYYTDWCSKEEFIQWCKDNRIKTQSEFKQWNKKNKRPDNIPYSPHIIYKDFLWGDISGFYRNREYISKKEFIQWCKDNNINNQTQFHKWCKKNKRPDNITTSPIRVYNDWSWADLSGRYLNVKWYSMKKFIKWCKDHGIKTKTSFLKWCKENQKPKNIPSNPQKVYKNWSWNNVT